MSEDNFSHPYNYFPVMSENKYVEVKYQKKQQEKRS